MKNKKIFKRLCLFIILPIIFGVLLFNLLPTNSKTAFACACGSPAFECYPDRGALADDPDIQDNVSPTSTDYNDPD